MRLPQSLTTVTPFSKLLAGILFITFVFAAFFFGTKYQAMVDLSKYQQSNLVTAKPSPTPSTETTGWKTYENKEFGFEVKYPDKIILEPSNPRKNSLQLSFKLSGQGLGNISVNVVPSGKNNVFEIPYSSSRKLGAYDAIIPSLLPPPLSPYEHYYVILYAGKQYAFTLNAYDKNGEDQIDQILSTFKFTDQNQIACTQEAKLCPDGKTYVSRTGHNCEFSPCP